jgi:glycosyltransferase involved in cell wall biosynthesis
MHAGENPRVLIVGENAALRMGGEASFPYLYFEKLRARGVEVWLACHARVRDELRELLGADFERVSFVEEDRLDNRLMRADKYLPVKLREQTVTVARHVRIRQLLRPIAREMIGRHSIDLIHEVTPIAPKWPTCLHGLGVPVLIGPLCGGMVYPPAFRYLEGRFERCFEWCGRFAADLVNHLIPGKLRAEALVIANEQTKRALPRGYRGMLYEGIPDIGVNLATWGRRDRVGGPRGREQVRFIFLGRLVNWKGVDLLLDAFARVVVAYPAAELEILGDGPMRGALEAQSVRLGIRDRVHFVGWVKPAEGAIRMQDADIFVLPSLRECGGSAAFEAMALGLPTIVARWGGPGLYVPDDCGIRVEPSSRDAFIAGLADAMLCLARDPQKRQRMGESAVRHASEGIFNWERKIDRFLEIYREVIAQVSKPPT